jgi:2-polyprenyl-3-methyl-5-hydroxy-6-metoxy-1,4-benzoquinol methylase
METDPRNFYDALANDYHLIFDDWDASVLRQSAVIHSLLGGQPQRVLDVACGMGTQAIGLARLGHAVVARDLSPALVKRASMEAERLGTAVDISVGDMRLAVSTDLSAFDAVIAFDNALPHLETNAELAAALKAFRLCPRLRRPRAEEAVLRPAAPLGLG